MNSPKRLRRIVGIFGGFAQAYVPAKMYAPRDAATTAGNVLANSGLVRIGVVALALPMPLFTEVSRKGKFSGS
jgi:hypothetical protein